MCRPLSKLLAVSKVKFYRGTTVDLNEMMDWRTENPKVLGMDKSQHEGNNADVVKYLQQPQHEVLLASPSRMWFAERDLSRSFSFGCGQYLANDVLYIAAAKFLPERTV
jgi:hypothetical protein